jgi:hypothetical protein
VRLNQRDRGRSELHDGRRIDESCVRIARTSRAPACAIFRRCLVARARRRPLLDVSHNVRHVPPNLIRLRPFHRRLLYGVLALLFFSGAGWAHWNDLVSSPGDFEMNAKAWAMKIHGAAAMVILLLVGMLLTGHVRFAWRARRNRGNGSLFLGAFGILIVTGYGLYYAGGESLRAWTSWIHLAVGLALPLLLILHIWLGKRTRPGAQLQKRPAPVAKLT